MESVKLTNAYLPKTIHPLEVFGRFEYKDGYPTDIIIDRVETSPSFGSPEDITSRCNDDDKEFLEHQVLEHLLQESNEDS